MAGQKRTISLSNRHEMGRRHTVNAFCENKAVEAVVDDVAGSSGYY